MREEAQRRSNLPRRLSLPSQKLPSLGILLTHSGDHLLLRVTLAVHMMFIKRRSKESLVLVP